MILMLVLQWCASSDAGEEEKKRCKLVLEMRGGIFNVEEEEGRGKAKSQYYFQLSRSNLVSMKNQSAKSVVG